MATTRVTRHVRAPRAKVYRALLDANAVQQWMVPTGMTSEIHAFDGREGGTFRISLTYEDPSQTGKSASHTDTFHGTFARLVPDELVVQKVEFETDNPAMAGEMTITYTLIDTGGETGIVSTHEGLPPGVKPEDNELGTRISLDKLAALVER